MITDDGLYRLAIFLGSAAMLMIILYHFLEVNSADGSEMDSKPLKTESSKAEKSAPSTR
jgi:oligosaccharyl transferase complex subunit OST4